MDVIRNAILAKKDYFKRQLSQASFFVLITSGRVSKKLKTQLKSKLCLISFLVFGFSSYSQDTIFLTSSSENIICTVREINPETVQFSYVGEELKNILYTNIIEKIVFSNGRIQKFTSTNNYKVVRSALDYENVQLTQLESEVKGLIKIGDVGSKAKGTTTLSNVEKVKNRAINKLKINAAMMGCNVIFITNQITEAVKGSPYYKQMALTNLTGIAYTNTLPSFEDFKKKIRYNFGYKCNKEMNLKINSMDLNEIDINHKFVIEKLDFVNGQILIQGEYYGNSSLRNFRVIYFDEEYFILYAKNKNSSYNLKIMFKNN